MSAVGAPGIQKGKDGTRQASLIAFMVDEAGVHELAQSLHQLGVTDAYIARGDIDTVIRHLSRVENPPRRLIVDISGLDQPLRALDRLAEACDPSVLVYALGDKNDVTLYRALLQAGVRDYRYKPLTGEALRIWIEDQDDQPVRQARTGKVIALTGTRGGVGTTAVAARLAAQLTEGAGMRRVVFLDLDFYGSIGSILLGMISSNHALSEMLQNIDGIDPQFLQRTLTSKDGKLFLLAANRAYSDTFTIEPDAISQLLKILTQHFHYVVVDLHQSGGVVANEVLSSASTVCLLADHSVYSAQVLTRLIQHVQARSNPPALHVVLNTSRAPVRGRVNTRDFAQAITHPISLEISYDGKLPGLAEDLGEPLASSSALAKAVTRLARMLTGELSQGGARSAGGWFRRTK